MPLNRDVFGNLTVYREFGSTPFREEDLRFVEMISRLVHFGALINMYQRVNTLVSPVSPDPLGHVEVFGKVFVNEYGKIEYIDDRARALMRKMGASFTKGSIELKSGDLINIAMLLDPDHRNISHRDFVVLALPAHEQILHYFSRCMPMVLFILPVDAPYSERIFLERTFSERYRCTPRESEIAYLYCMRNTRSEIALMLGNTDETVKTHLKHIFRKLDVTSRQELWNLANHIEARPPGILPNH